MQPGVDCDIGVSPLGPNRGFKRTIEASEIQQGGSKNKMDEKQAKRLLSVHEAACYLGLSPRTLYSAVAPKSKKPFPVKPKRIGKLVRFDRKDLDRYIDALDSVSNERF